MNYEMINCYDIVKQNNLGIQVRVGIDYCFVYRVYIRVTHMRSSTNNTTTNNNDIITITIITMH